MSDSFAVAAGYIMPHPPIIIPGVNKGPVMAAETIEAMESVSAQVESIKPDTVIIISPHAPLYSDFIFMYDNPLLQGDFSRFGAGRVKLSISQDTGLLRMIEAGLQSASIPGGAKYEADLDHGVTVPLFYLSKAYHDFKLIAMSCSGLSIPVLNRIGGVIAKACADSGKRIVVVASGDMSHKVNDESPYGSVPEGAEFDRRFVGFLKSGDLAGLQSIESVLRRKAAECGYNSAVILCGVFNGMTVATDVLSYEAPYGIGYCVASIKSIERQVNGNE